jgi:hypothetical protein
MEDSKTKRPEIDTGTGNIHLTLTREKQKAKMRKRSSPFRIKLGCLVALRYRTEGNDITIAVDRSQRKEGGTHDFDCSSTDQYLSLSEIWADPQPGRDEGLALIGRRVRCCFPKRVLSETFHKRSTTRYLEGEVVCIPDYNSQWEKQRGGRRRREATGTKVDLLVDRDKLDDLPFLRRSDTDVDADFAQLSEASKRHLVNEQRMKGGDKVTVEVVLGDYMVKNMHRNNNILEARWVIRKRVPVNRPTAKRPRETTRSSILRAADNNKDDGLCQDATLDTSTGNPFNINIINNNNNNNNGTPGATASRKTVETLQPSKRRKLNTSREYFIGNGNDSRIQQESNWRWWACRCHDVDVFKDQPSTTEVCGQSSNQFIGEVVSIQPSSTGSTTLAAVTMKRLFLPEQTRIGRMSHHKSSEVFDSFDCCRYSSNEDGTKIGFESPYLVRVPIEQLIIVSRKLSRSTDSPNTKCEKNLLLEVTRSYSWQLDVFFSLSTTVSFVHHGPPEKVGNCFRCKEALNTAMQTCDSRHVVCDLCQEFMHEVQEANPCGDTEPLCDCSRCQMRLQVDRQKKFLRGVPAVAIHPRALTFQIGQIPSEDKAAFPVARDMVKTMSRYGFSLINRGNLNPVPSLKPITRKPVYKVKAPRNKKTSVVTTGIMQGRFEPSPSSGGRRKPFNDPIELSSSCSRLLVYNNKARNLSGDSKGRGECRDRVRNKRLTSCGQTLLGENDKEERMINSRAVRANQRRLFRDVSVFGVGLDTLAGREQMLRFDRSSVHAWGVFADEDIKEGDMVIEYRGEIVGNAVAEKREHEYEKAKIGSDYMFRIDSSSVCDATKQGNVARFINASCDPNCFTKIIAIDGAKRIVVYAKRDITSGEELCYDYKFPLEYEERNRIPCGCQSQECCGFLNWVGRLYFQ